MWPRYMKLCASGGFEVWRRTESDHEAQEPGRIPTYVFFARCNTSNDAAILTRAMNATGLI